MAVASIAGGAAGCRPSPHRGPAPGAGPPQRFVDGPRAGGRRYLRCCLEHRRSPESRGQREQHGPQRHQTPWGGGV